MKETRQLQTITRWTARRGTTLRRSANVFALFAAIAASACGGDAGGSTGPNSGVVGSYSMSTVNGKGLPVAVASDTSGLYKYEITSGTIALTADGKYSVVTNYRQTIPGNVSVFVDSTGGTWTQTGTVVLLTNAQDGSKDTAAWSNAQLTFTEIDGTVTTTFVYALKK